MTVTNKDVFVASVDGVNYEDFIQRIKDKQHGMGE